MREALLVLAFLLSCQARPDPARPADDSARAAAPVDAASEDESALTGRIWVRTDSPGLPGAFRLFLADGTLIQDSCWETYRLSEWRMESDGTLSWEEDGAEIRADVLTSNEKELVLRLNLVSGTVDQHFVPATVPYLCPDMPR